MIRNLKTIWTYFLIWVIFFFLERAIFLLFFIKKLKDFSFPEIATSFLYGLWMDCSMAGYFSVIPLLGFILWWFIPALKIEMKVICSYFRTLVVLSSLTTVINLNIYREWGAKVNRRAFEFLVTSPGEAFASSVSSPLFLSFLILVFLIISGFSLFRLLSKQKLDKAGKLTLKIPVAVLLLGINFLAIRGGWQLAPMNESMAYFSAKPILNHAAVNTDWALLRSLFKSSSNKNPYQFYSTSQANQIVRQLYPSTTPDSTQSILSVKRPNIILVILESFTADLVEPLGGEEGITPGINSLLEKGVLFNNIYASGDRTDKGVVAILSAFPTQGAQSIMKEDAKQAKLPSLFSALKRIGYHGTYYYGGETEFANMKSYLLNTGCEALIDKSNFDEKDMNSKWGAYDDVVYDRLLKDSRSKTTPFFTTLLTLTNHEPFELPGASKFKGEEVENKFRSTAYYTDSCLAAFIHKAKKYSWYKNTLFVVVADHGHRLPKNQYEIYDAHRYRIPLLLYGDVIKPAYRGTEVGKVGSQTDIAATLLAQLKTSYNDFAWSKDLYSPKVKGHAFYSWENGFGWVNAANQALTFDKVSQSVVFVNNGLKEEEPSLRVAKAYMQAVYQTFINY